jgi:hypothetical protein
MTSVGRQMMLGASVLGSARPDSPFCGNGVGDGLGGLVLPASQLFE